MVTDEGTCALRRVVEWESHNPLAERDVIGQEVVHEIGRALRHPSAQAAWAPSSSFTGYRDNTSSRTPLVLANQEGSAPTQETAVEVTLELISYESRERCRPEALFDSGVERLQVVLHDLVECRSFGFAAFVGGSGPTDELGASANIGSGRFRIGARWQRQCERHPGRQCRLQAT